MITRLIADTSMREVLSKAALGFSLRIAGAAAQFGFTVLLARFYGAEGMGAYTLALSVTVIASAVSRWGMDQAALKNIAVYADTNAWAEAKTAFASALAAILITGTVVTLFLFLLSPWITETFFSNRQLVELMRIMVLSIVPFALLNLLAESFRAVKRVAANTAVQVVAVPLLMLAGLFFLYRSGSTQVIHAAYIYLLACVAVSAGALVYWCRLLRGKEGYMSPSRHVIRDLLRMAGPMAWTTIIGIGMSFSETLLLGVFRTVEEVGIYSAALRVALLVNFVLVAFNTILAPKIASLFHNDERVEIERLASHSVMVMLMMTAPLFILCFGFPEKVLSLFGPEFIAGSVTLMVLACGQLLNVMTGPVNIMLLMTGHELEAKRNRIISAVTGVVAGLTLIPQFGIAGAAFSALIGGAVLQWLSVRSVKVSLNVHLLPVFKS